MNLIFGILVAVVLVIGAIMLIAFCIAIVMAIIEFALRLTLAAALSVFVGVVAGFSASRWGYDGPISGTVAALLTFIPAFVLVWRWRDSRWSKRSKSVAKQAPQAEICVPHKLPIEEDLGLENSADLVAAWDTAQQIAPRESFETDRERCARFLRMFDTSDDCGTEEIELAMFIRTHVPGLVSETQKVLNGADECEQDEAIAAMIAGLRQLGGDARVALENRHQAARERLSIRQERFAMRAADQKGWL